jgi:hypothetical protein
MMEVKIKPFHGVFRLSILSHNFTFFLDHVRFLARRFLGAAGQDIVQIENAIHIAGIDYQIDKRGQRDVNMR